MQSWHATDALKTACDKGHNWFTSRANKFKTVKSGYNKIRPKMLPESLSTFKKEHCDGLDDNDDRASFLKSRSRIHSVDVIDNNLRLKFNEQYCVNSEIIHNIATMDINGL